MKSENRGPRARRGLAMALLCSALVFPAVAQARPQAFDISDPGLEAALLRFASQADVQVVMEARNIAGMRAARVKGRLEPRAALRALIRDATINVEWLDASTVAIRSAAPRVRAVTMQAPVLRREQSQELTPPPPTTAESDSGDIVVTAQRRTQLLQDVPISAVVQSGTQLAKTGTLNLESLAVRTPAVRISTAPVSDFITIRGVGSSLNLGFEQSVATFVDGVYRGRSRSTRAALFDVDRVEVLKGPQTTFFGNNAIAGAFNITTRKPGDRLEANALASYVPDTQEYVAEAGVSVPLTDTLSVRAAGRLSGMDGWIENENLSTDEPHIRERIGRFSVRWEPADNIETNARIDAGRARNRGVLSSQLLYCPPAFSTAAGVCARYLTASGGAVDDELDGRSAANFGYFNYNYLEAAQTTSIGIGEHSLIFTTGWFDHDYDLLNDTNPVPAGKGGSVQGTTQTVPARFIEDFHQFSQEVRLQSPSGGALEYMVGAYYAHSRLLVNGFQGLYQARLGALAQPFYDATSRIAFHVGNREVAETRSIFGSATIRLAPPLRLNLGARYSEVEKKAHRIDERGTAGSIPGFDNFVPGSAQANAALIPILGVDAGEFDRTRRTDKKFLPATSLQYDVTPDIMAYGSYARGFKAGGFSAYISKSIFGPETVDSYELGVKSRLFDRAATLNVALFLSDYKDLQETTTVLLENGSQVQIVGNIARSRSKGIEFGASWRVTDGFTVSTDLAYLDAKYEDYSNAPCTVRQSIGVPNCKQDLSGKRRAFAPKYSGSFNAQYQTDFTDTLRLRLDGTAYFTSRFFSQPIADPFLAQEGYVKFDARIGIGTTDDQWEFAVVGKNLTNKRTASFRQPVATSAGSFQALEDPTRAIGFQLSWRY